MNDKKQMILDLVEEMLNNGNLKEEKFIFYQEHKEVFQSEFERMFNGKSTVKQEVTEKGKKILKAMAELGDKQVAARDIAKQLSLSGANQVTGAMLKLVKDGYVAKTEDHVPTLYVPTEKGKNFIQNN